MLKNNSCGHFARSWWFINGILLKLHLRHEYHKLVAAASEFLQVIHFFLIVVKCKESMKKLTYVLSLRVDVRDGLDNNVFELHGFNTIMDLSMKKTPEP